MLTRNALHLLALVAGLAPLTVQAIPAMALAKSNPFTGYKIYANPNYASQISASVVPHLTGSLKSEAAEVAKGSTFFWLDTAQTVPTMGRYLSNIKKANAAEASPPVIGALIVYDLPDRDCAALASNEQYSIADGGMAKYKTYIDNNSGQLKEHSRVKVALTIGKCADAASAYKECVTYAIKTLNLPNVAMYLDAGHAGWLGWPANVQPAIDLFASLYKNASFPAAVRGLATSVAIYNTWTIATCPSYTQGDSNCDEKKYVDALAPLLKAQNFPAHFITDTGRNGVQPTKQQAWGDWCNVIGTGFGVRPTTNTRDVLEDAFVWVKPGGESDRTSDSSALRYDAHCGYSDALKPDPQAGQWFEAYIKQLLTNANPFV